MRRTRVKNGLIISIILFAMLTHNVVIFESLLPVHGQVSDGIADSVEPAIVIDDSNNRGDSTISRNKIDIITDVSPPTNKGADKFPTTAIFNNKLYIAWTSSDPEITNPTLGGDPDYDIVIRSFDGQTWSEIYELSPQAIETTGNTGESEGRQDDYFPNLIAYQDKLFVFWMHGIYVQYEPSVIRMRYFDGDLWSNVINFSYGGPGDGVTYKDKLYYAWYGGEQYYNYSFHVKSFDGTTWSVPKANDSNEGSVSDLKVNEEDNSLYVCWGNTDNTCMKRFNGSTWDDKIVIDEQGQSGWESESDNGPELCFFNGSGNIIWSEPHSIKFRSFEGPNLSDIILLNKTPADQHKYNPKLIKFRNKLFASWDYGSWSKKHIVLRAFNGNTWEDIQELTPNSESRNSHLQLIEFNDALYLTWQTNDPNISTGADLDIVIRPLFGSFLACTDKPQTIFPGESAVYNITVSNIAVPKSQADNNLKLEVTGLPAGWGAQFDKPEVNLDISESINVNLTITAPNDAIKDQWANISISCSQKDLMVFEDSITISTFMDVQFNFSLGCVDNIRYIAPEESIFYPILMRNNGNVNDTIDLSLSVLPPLPPTYSFWSLKLDQNCINLTPYSSGIISLNVTAPATATNGEEVFIKILGTSQRNPGGKSIIQTQTIVKLVQELELYCSNPKHYVNPGELTVYEINITNNGNDVDKIIISALEFSWDVSLSQNIITLPPFSSQSFNFSIQIPTLVIANTINIGIIKAKSFDGNVTDTLNIVTIINQIYYLSASMDLKYVKTVPNSTTNFIINISNGGNGDEAIEILINNLSFYCRLNSGVEYINQLLLNLGPYEKNQLNFSIYVPINTLPGDYKIEINLSSKAKNMSFKIYFEILQDSDNDTVHDGIDAFPNNPSYSFDTDFDGLPNAWEIYYGLDPYDLSDSNQDKDGDRFSNLEEFIAGTDPTNPNEHPEKNAPDQDKPATGDDNGKGNEPQEMKYLIYILLTIFIITGLIILGIIITLRRKLKERD